MVLHDVVSGKDQLTLRSSHMQELLQDLFSPTLDEELEELDTRLGDVDDN